MSKLLTNDQNKVLVGSNGKAYAVGNMDALIGTSSPATITAAAGKVLKLLRYGKCEQSGTPTLSVPVPIVCNNGTLSLVDDELPTGYRRLLGIDYDGNTHYETGEKLYGSDVITLTLSGTSTTGQNVFGCYSGTASGNQNFSLYVYGNGSSSKSYYRYGDTLYRPTYGSGTRTLSFGNLTSTSGFATNVNTTPDTFESTSRAYIGWLPNSSSPHYTGNIIGEITVGDRLKWVPCERVSDEVIGYYEVVNGTFLEPSGSGTPVSTGYDDSHLVIGVVGTAEAITLGAQSTSVEDLLAVGDYVDEQDIISGKLTRRCGVCVYDGTQTIGDVFLSTTGGKDSGAIIVYPLATPTTENVTPQPLNTGAGTNTLTDTAAVSNPKYNLIYKI